MSTTSVLTISNTNNRMVFGKKRSDNASVFSPCVVTNKDVVVSPDRFHHDTAKEKSKIKHAAMLLPEKLEHAAATKIKHAAQLVPSDVSPKKRSLVSDISDNVDAALVSPLPPSKRHRSEDNVSIQRTPKKVSKKIPEPPTEDPPEPTKFMKVLLLGPAGQGKKEWVQGLTPSFPTPASANATPNSTNTFRVDYYSKDYSFEASSAEQETVRLHMYSVDCDATTAPPATWKHSLIPSMHHVVLVLDLFAVPDAKEALLVWKSWLERFVKCKTTATANIPISLLLVNHSSRTKEVVTVPSTLEWFKLGATVEKICQSWHINKWYMMENKETSSDIILQTMIERTWSVMGKEQMGEEQQQKKEAPEVEELSTRKATGAADPSAT